MKTLSEIPRELTKNNIESTIEGYRELLKSVPLKIESKNLLQLLTYLKRTNIKSGPYPNVTFFESANRIMTDLTILLGIQALLNGVIPEIEYDKYTVELGHDNRNGFDIMAECGEKRLVGEAFNVAKQYFQGKKTEMLKKLREQRNSSDQMLLIYNSDAVSPKYKPRCGVNEFHLKVEIKY